MQRVIWDLIETIRVATRPDQVDWSVLTTEHYTASEAITVLEEVARAPSGSTARLEGTIAGDLVVDDLGIGLDIVGRVTGDLDIRGASGFVAVSGQVDGSVLIRGMCGGFMALEGSTMGSLVVIERRGADGAFVPGSTRIDGMVRAQGSVAGDVTIHAQVGGLMVRGQVEGRFSFAGRTADGIQIEKRFSATGVNIEGDVGGHLQLGGAVREGVVVHVRTVDAVTADSIDGSLTLRGDVLESMTISGPVTGDVDIAAAIERGLEITGDIGGDLTLRGTVPPADAEDEDPGEVDESDRTGLPSATAEVVRAGIGGDCHVDTTIGGNVILACPIGGDLTVAGSISGDLLLADHSLDLFAALEAPGEVVAGSATIRTDVAGSLWVRDPIGGRLRVSGTIGHETGLDAPAGAIELTGRFGDRVGLAPPAGSPISPLVSVAGARFGKNVFIGDHISIATCDFRQCLDVDRLELVGSALFLQAGNGKRTAVRALANPPAGSEIEIPAGEMASIYRQLRTNLEGRSNRPAAAFFYRGEMDARLARTREQGWAGLPERSVLEAYRIVSGYGLKMLRPAMWFLALALLGTIAFEAANIAIGAATDPNQITEPSVIQTFTFTVQSMVSFFNPPAATLTTAALWVQIGLRFLGPLLLAQFALALRDRVAR